MVRILISSWLRQRKDSKRKFRELLGGALKEPVISFQWKGRMKRQKSSSIFLKMKKSFRSYLKNGRKNKAAATISQRYFLKYHGR
jgi:hypothetical protein